MEALDSQYAQVHDLEAGARLKPYFSDPAPQGTTSDTDDDDDDDSTSSWVSDDLGSDWDFDRDGEKPPDSRFSIRRCDCFPNNETMEECKARIARIVRFHTKCYGTSVNETETKIA